MTRVHFVKKSRKAYPDDGIKKGEPYFWWKFRHGCKHRSKKQPKPSQLTQSEFWSEVYTIQEEMDGGAPSATDLSDMVEDIKSRLEQLLDDTRDKFDNVPEQLQSGHALEERIEALEEALGDIDNVDLEKPDDASDDDEDWVVNAWDGVKTALDLSCS